MRIGIDVDEVLCKTNKCFIDYFNKKYNSSYDRENITEYNYKSFVFHDNDFVISELKDFIDNNLDKFDVICGAREVLSKLKDEGNELIIITSRRVAIREKTIAWLKNQFGNDFFDEFLIYNGNFKEEKCKSEISKENGIDVLIEDAPHFAIKTSAVGIPVLLFDCPWNKNLEENEFLIRVRNWDEISEKIGLFLKAF